MINHPGSPRQGNTFHKDFDPFNDRLSRDIRNTLSEAFVDSLAEMAPTGYQTVAAKWLAGKSAAGYIKYIQDRLLRYDRVLAQATVTRLTDALLQSLVIWNNGLFFEFHEHLERIWQKTTGDEYQALKGLIKAAGVYIHMEHNRQEAVKSLSIKSLNLLRRYSYRLTFITNLDVLIKRLENSDPVSPKLENPALRQGQL
ncbi:MAG: DUF309 domain-containing protein [Desulfobacterales bacterium]|jgi:hypothetical protein